MYVYPDWQNRASRTCAPPTFQAGMWSVIMLPGRSFTSLSLISAAKISRIKAFFWIGGCFSFQHYPPRTLKLTPQFFRYSAHKHSSGFETDPAALKPPFFQTATAKFYTQILRSNLPNFHPLNSGYVKVSNKTPSQENGLCSFPYVKAKASRTTWESVWRLQD